MKLKLLLTALLFTFAFSNSYASFPVKRTVKTVTTVDGNTNVEESIMVSPAAAAGQNWVFNQAYNTLGQMESVVEAFEAGAVESNEGTLEMHVKTE